MSNKNTDNANNTADSESLGQQVADGGSYELIRQRLQAQGKNLSEQLNKLNQQREQAFGKTTSAVIARIRVRSENNCVPRDIVRVGQYLLFGYNVFIGMKTTTQIDDVFALYQLKSQAGVSDNVGQKNNNTQADVEMVAAETAGTFLSDSRFQTDFSELYSYYKNTKLAHLHVTHNQLLAVFQIGDSIGDIRAFRWQIHQDGKVTYIDNRGERDIKLPPPYDFEWTTAERSHYAAGRLPQFALFDKVFVTVEKGKLIWRIEDNTELGETIFQEAVEDTHQSLDDLDVRFAQIGTLVVMLITPYGEKATRGYIFDNRTQRITRADALDSACVQLPEDHGIIFPGGYYLTGGDYKLYADDVEGLRFKRRLNAPNGEDVLFVFYEEAEGRFALYSYNLVKKQLETPLFAHGYSLFEDGKLLIFKAESDEPTRIHPMQLWQTPYVGEAYYAAQPVAEGFFSTIGNAEMVRAIAELNFISRLIDNQSPNTGIYEDIIHSIQKLCDSYYWLDSKEAGQLNQPLTNIAETAELVLVEFEKVKTARRQADTEISLARQAFVDCQRHIELNDYDTPQPFVSSLLALKRQKGQLMSLRENRYIDHLAVNQLDGEVDNAIEALGHRAVRFLSGENALQSITDNVETQYNAISNVKTVSDLSPISEALSEQSEGLDALTDVINSLHIDDTTQKTAILEAVSQVYGRINQTKAHAKLTIKQLSATESVAEFGAQLAVLSQSVSAALANVETPDDCDESLSRLLVQVEELASRFSEQEQFLGDIFSKRDEIVTAFEEQKQRLSDEQQRRAQSLMTAAERILESIKRRSLQFNEQDELNTYFSADSMVLKVAELSEQLRDLNDNVKADDLDAQYKHLREQAIRSLRDKSEIFEDGGNVIKLGKHRFSVNTQKPDLTLLPRDEEQVFHITGTDFYQAADDEQLNKLRPYWSQNVVSETPTIYRGEYLAYAVFGCVEKIADADGKIDLSALQQVVKSYADENYRDGYEKGVHDHDSIKILQALMPVYRRVGLLRFTASARALAWLFLAQLSADERTLLEQRASSAVALRQHLHSKESVQILRADIQNRLTTLLAEQATADSPLTKETMTASSYLVEVLATLSGSVGAELAFSHLAERLYQRLNDSLDRHGQRNSVNSTLDLLPLFDAFAAAYQWVSAIVEAANANEQIELQRFTAETAAYWLLQVKKTGNQLRFTTISADLSATADNLLGEHRLITDRQLPLALDDFLQRLANYQQHGKVGFETYLHLRQSLLANARKNFDLENFTSQPLSTFVRNKLINDSYLPIIGDNLAKQMGAMGADKRSDLMGLLLLISPPGYGKTTLMEYVANRLGLNFMKINCPSLGHEIKSLDPATANSATAKQELERLNLALEMGNNVMLYLDDIQHTHAEFLQKFISLCDGSRKIDGVWQGQSKTYNLRGKKFCVIMAGNPYTESGEVFKIPDMLANRADVYNLGDILSGQQHIFELSYLENALTSNPTLAPLALRGQDDVYRFIDLAEGKSVADSDFSHSYSNSERDDIVSVLKKLMRVRDTVLKVNQAYIQSAAMDDHYREAPPFKLQGSYRNMNKMAEKIVALMDDSELTALTNDHYLSEAQLLTTGAEENILAFKSLSGLMTDEEQQRHQRIISEFKARNAVGSDDPATRIAKQIARLHDGLTENIGTATEQLTQKPDISQALGNIESTLGKQSDELRQTLLQSLTKLAPEKGVNESITKSIEKLQIGLSEPFEQLLCKLTAQEKLSTGLTRVEANINELKQTIQDSKVSLEQLTGIDEKLTQLNKTFKGGLTPIVEAMRKEIGIDEKLLQRITDVYQALERLGKNKTE